MPELDQTQADAEAMVTSAESSKSTQSKTNRQSSKSKNQTKRKVQASRNEPPREPWNLNQNSIRNQNPPPLATRNIYFILDNSACTLGIGNIQRWFDWEFVQSQIRGPEKIHLNLYVPQYTLRELDFRKRGPMIGISLAQEALALIDTLFEIEPSRADSSLLQSSDDDGYGTNSSSLSPIPFNIYVEEILRLFPSWEKCLKYRLRQPKKGEFSLIRTPNEESEMEQDADINSRLKNLIRSCVYMTKMISKDQSAPQGDHWRLVTEDQATKIWATSFGIDCLNVNEAELLLFHGNDVTKFELANPEVHFFSSRDVFDRETSVGLHKKVDTTKYPYESIAEPLEEKAKKSKRLKKLDKSTKALKQHFVKVDGISYEEFALINYAPRVASVSMVESKFLDAIDRPLS